MQQVLVTGASSKLIQGVCANLMKDGFQFTGVSRTKKNKDSNLYAEWISADLSTEINSINFSKFQTIIHAAACTHAFSYEAYKKINVDVTQEIVTKAKASGVENFIFISSRAAVNNGGWYAATKLEAEKIVLEHFPNAIIIKPSEIYGGTKQEGIDALIEKVKNKKFIFYPSGINDKMYPIQIDDATDYIAKIIGNNKSGDYIVNGPEGFTMLELIHHLAKTFNKKIIAIPIPQFVLRIICFLQQFLKLKIGIYPDQLKRLIAPKPNSVPPSYIRTIKETLS
ncbi:MAG: NAD-dependent epimerase/dehydratase family protein [Chitinophagaceae bacterium]|nr:NAD-dependent epimerase/dehydratase family protein [Chitinophagaceae bacterium]